MKGRRKMGLLGEVDLLGLDVFGNPRMDPVVGVGVGAAATSLVRHIAKANNAKWGFVAGALATAILYWQPKTRGAAMGSAAGTVVASGLLDGVISKVLGVFGMGSGMAGMGLPQIGPAMTASPLFGLGLPSVSNEAPVYGAHLGLPGINEVPHAYGVWNAPGGGMAGTGFAGPQIGQAPPVDLLGNPTAQSQQLELMGGPTISGLAAAYGATLLGHNT